MAMSTTATTTIDSQAEHRDSMPEIIIRFSGQEFLANQKSYFSVDRFENGGFEEKKKSEGRETLL